MPDSIVVTLRVPRERKAQLIELIQQQAHLFAEFTIQDPAAPPYPDKSLFLTYRRADSEDVCGRIYDRLIGFFGPATVFKDLEDIPPGVDFRRVLEREIASTDMMLVIMGRDWDSADNLRRMQDPADFVRLEIEMALQRDIPVIPVFVQRRTTMPDPAHLPAELRPLIYRNAVQARPDPDFHLDMNRLIQAIQTLFEMQDRPGGLLF